MAVAEDILKQYFGHDKFRPVQKEIVENILQGKDTIALLPTGGGKSVCFQVPAMMMEGTCIVVTPLIALMKDQVENLRKKNIPALALFSGIEKKELEFELESCVNGKYKFLYLSPERLSTRSFRDYAIHMDISFLAIDEAHCISQWGYDFRPPYLKIAEFRSRYSSLPCMALTASATPDVVKDIADKLELKQPAVFSKSFTRSNLAYVVQETENKHGRILEICNKLQGSGLVYVKSRKKTQEIAEYLIHHKISADNYHAGLESDERSSRQESWKRGETRIMVCTNAFGMGIDKSDCRFVIHEQKPDTLEAYYQEAGRAGRDEQNAYCILLHHASDFLDDKKNTELKYPSPKEISRVYELICNYLKVAVASGQGKSYDFDLNEFCIYYKLKPGEVYNTLKILEAEGYFQASEAIYIPSRLKILLSYSDLYEWQLQNEELNFLFKIMLRSYGGLFDFYTMIWEQEIARRMQKPEKWVREQLSKLKLINIVDYVPRVNKPQLLFIENRMSSIYISDDRIKFLRKRYEDKLGAMNRYILDRDKCRSLSLVSYFGEKDAKDCGKCDVCLARRKSRNGLSDTQRMEIVRSFVANGRFRTTDLRRLVSETETPHYLQLLRRLSDSGYMKENAEGYWLWTEKKS